MSGLKMFTGVQNARRFILSLGEMCVCVFIHSSCLVGKLSSLH